MSEAIRSMRREGGKKAWLLAFLDVMRMSVPSAQVKLPRHFAWETESSEMRVADLGAG